ncbi:MAG: methyl-accepting chemotaxis protein [Ignavibacteriaceae bacterium]
MKSLLSDNNPEKSNQDQKNLEPGLQAGLTELLNSIECTSSSIGSLTGNFEKDFLAIGGKMQRFVSDSKDLSTDSSRIASVITESFLKKGITELNLLLQQFSDYLSKSVEDIKNEIIELNLILDKIGDIIDNLENFYKIVKQMRMLCISTKIESARLGNDDRGFNMLADNVEKLANFINDKVKQISVKSNDLSKKIIKSSSELEHLMDEQHLQAKIILRNTNNTLNVFENKYHETSAKAENISLCANDVFKTVNKIVVLIQFHDINRQKLEHISEALNRVVNEISQGGINELEINSYSDKYGLAHDVCELQIIQLQNARDEFVNAVLDIIKNLENVEKDIDDIHNEITTVLGEETIFSKTSLDDVKNELISIQAGLNKNGVIGQGIASSIKSVVNIVDNLSKDLFEIEEVGTEIELIALNAIIKAARTGSEGAALGVLAESIQRLSFDAKTHTTFSSQILEKISATSMKLKGNMDSDLIDDKTGQLLSTNQKISDIIMTIGKLGNEAGSMLKKVTTHTVGLKRNINSTVSGITIHESFREKATLLIDELSAIIRRIKEKNILKSNRKLHTEDLQKRYTMHSERTIHKNFISNAGEGKKSGLLNPKEKEGLFIDDNIELF